MRWENLTLDREGGDAASRLPLAGAVVRTFDTPRFAGMTFYEVAARSVLNRVPAGARVPFRWTVNPYRGCSHACTYCFARRTHTYLDLDSGEDFDRRIVVKVNAPEVLRRELAAAPWRREHVAMGTNVDPYQRAEGRYRLMRGILAALRDARTPFSVLTKGSLVLRDLDLLVDAAGVTEVSTNVSVGSVDDDVWRALEPGTPSPRRRLAVCAALADAGIPCGVLMAPILPGLSDSPGQLAATVRAIAASGATHLSPIVLHLRPGAREWFLRWVDEHRPDLRPLYDELYPPGRAYAPKSYQRRITETVRHLAAEAGIGRAAPDQVRRLQYGVASRSLAAAGPAPLSYDQQALI